MPLYEMTSNQFRPLSSASFVDQNVRERDDLQRLLKTQINVLGDDLYVLTEEFSDWEDSRRRIDLLAIDRDANLVVIELKRTSDGGHMELQAIRYASMISAMTFEKAEGIHQDFLRKMGEMPEAAKTRMLSFLNWEEPDEESFASEVRIVLVSEDFGKELTTAVLWLREHDIDIRCIRLRPYQDGEKLFVDVQQILPLPEAHDYQVQLREKEHIGRINRAERYDLRLKFWKGLILLARSQQTRHANITPGEYGYIGASAGINGLRLNYTITKNAGLVELYIDGGVAEENNRIFDKLYENRNTIERAFGDSISWDRLDHRQACRIKYQMSEGGYRSPEQEWPKIQSSMIDAMTRLESSLRPYLESLGG